LLLCPVMCQLVALRTAVLQGPRTNSGQRPGETSGAYNRSLAVPRPFCPIIMASGLRLADVPDSRAGLLGSSPSCLHWAAGWPRPR
jgi:hypothetical protein